MKDYSNNVEERKKFVLSYKVDESEKSIRVQYADGGFKWLTYTEKSEKEILKRMKIQVNKAYKKYKDYENYYDKMNFISLIALTFLVITFSLVCISPLFLIIPLCSATVAIFTQIKAFELKEIKNDLRKNYLFLKNEKVINDKEMCERAFRRCYRKDVKEKLNDRKVKFTINNIEEFSFEDMVYLDNKFQYYREIENEKYTNNCVKRKRKVK